MAHVCLINSNPAPETRGLNTGSLLPPVGLATIAAVLEAHGHKVTIIDTRLFQQKIDTTVNNIAEDVGYVGINIDSFTFNTAKELCKIIKIKNKNTFIVLGGPYAHISPSILLNEFECDCVVQGEGEYALLEIVNVKENKQIDFSCAPGTWWKNSTGMICHTPQQRITDLDALPFPAYHLLPSLSSYKSFSRQTPSAPLITSRGCAFSCNFCSRGAFHGKVVFRSAQNVIDEIDFLVQKYGIRHFDILDDNFALHKQRMHQIFDKIIERGYNLTFNLNSGIRSEGLTHELFSKMKKAGVTKVSFGIESADENVLKLCNKHLNLDDIRNAVQFAKEAKLLTSGFFIIGLPGESATSFKKTMQFAKEIDTDFANFCMAIPFPGTELYNQIAKSGKFIINVDRNIAYGLFGNKVFCTYEEQNEHDILQRYNDAYKEFYSFSRKMKIILKCRSLNEFRWVAKNAWTVLSNFISKKTKD